MSDNIEVSVVIPTLNEEITIGQCVEKAMKKFKELGVKGEVVISDSHSKDKTVEVATSKGARVVYQPLRGYGNAYHKGIAEAKGKIIIIGDADNTYDFSEIAKFIEPIQKNECDMVIGNRLNNTIEKKAMPWLHRLIGTPIMTFVVNLLFKTHIKDCNSGMRSFTKDTFKKMNLKSPGWEFASEMVIKSGLLGLRIKDIDITLHKDMAGRIPHLNPWKAAINNFMLMFTFSAKFIFFIPGVALLLAGLFLSAAILLQGELIFQLGNFGLNNLTLVAGMFMVLAGTQLLWLSLISRIYIYFHRLNYIDEMTKYFMQTQWLSIYTGLAISAFSLILGAALILLVTESWAQAGFSSAPRGFKTFVLGSSLLFFSLQTFFNYFIVHIIRDEIRFTLGTEGTNSIRA